MRAGAAFVKKLVKARVTQNESKKRVDGIAHETCS
jgi:hypothetical protein